MTMLKLKEALGLVAVVIRYKGFVLVAAPDGDRWKVTAWQPVETEEETGEAFQNLRLENITEWEGQRFDTEGEALMAGMQFIEWKF